jgi:transposase
MMKVTTLGIDLAKSIFRLHGVDERGKVVLRRQVTRNSYCRWWRSLLGV